LDRLGRTRKSENVKFSENASLTFIFMRLKRISHQRLCKLLAEADLKDTGQKSNVKLITLNDVAKYFTHGILYSLLFLVEPIGWYPVILLILIEGVLGWVITIVLFVLVLGFSSSIISSYLWPPVKLSLWRILFQGLILLVTLGILNTIFITWDIWISGIFILLPSSFLLENAMAAAKLVLGSLLIGFVGRKGAEWLRKRETIKERNSNH
jgi:hypothetical protein